MLQLHYIGIVFTLRDKNKSKSKTNVFRFLKSIMFSDSFHRRHCCIGPLKTYKCYHKMQSVWCQFANEWGEVGNYMQSVSNNRTVPWDKSSKITYPLLSCFPETRVRQLSRATLSCAHWQRLIYTVQKRLMQSVCIYKLLSSYLQTFSNLRVIVVGASQTASVWRNVASHQATGAITFQSKVAIRHRMWKNSIESPDSQHFFVEIEIL